jgi:hypothetical protein
MVEFCNCRILPQNSFVNSYIPNDPSTMTEVVLWKECSSPGCCSGHFSCHWWHLRIPSVSVAFLVRGWGSEGLWIWKELIALDLRSLLPSLGCWGGCPQLIAGEHNNQHKPWSGKAGPLNSCQPAAALVTGRTASEFLSENLKSCQQQQRSAPTYLSHGPEHASPASIPCRLWDYRSVWKLLSCTLLLWKRWWCPYSW